MRINLPTDLLRSFVAIVDTGSMVRASEHIYLTQSALSLQMKRLAEIVQQPIFSRHQGVFVLTVAGESLLACAREMLALNDGLIAELGGRLTGPVRIGMVQDLADEILSSVLARFKRSNPDIRMEIRVGNSAELRDLVASDLLDIALYLGPPGDRATVATAPMIWLGDPDLLLQPILPVAIMTRPCVFRDAALDALEAAGRHYAIAVETPSISVLRAAVESGLAVTCRNSALLGHKVPPLDVGTKPLPHIAYNLTMRDAAHAAVSGLAELLRGALVNV